MVTILVFEIKEGKNAQKVNKLLTIIYHYLVVKKRNNLKIDFVKQGQRIKPKTYLPFIYLLFFAGLFV